MKRKDTEQLSIQSREERKSRLQKVLDAINKLDKRIEQVIEQLRKEN